MHTMMALLRALGFGKDAVRNVLHGPVVFRRVATAGGAERASMSSEIALRNRSFHLLFGDKMRTVRAAPVLDACDVLLIDALHEEESNSASGGIVKKLIADLPNARCSEWSRGLTARISW